MTRLRTWSHCLKRLLFLRPSECRECGAHVRMLNDVCSVCGIKNPVQLPKSLGLFLVVFTYQQALVILKNW